jgi:peptidoglycan-N-acetylglucosamine deacetylase
MRARLTVVLPLIAAIAGAVLVAACASIPSARRNAVALWGFTAPWDGRSAASLEAHGAQLDVAVTGWVGFDTVTSQPVELYADTTRIPASAATRRMALVTSYLGDRFHPELVRRLAADPPLLATTAAQLAALASAKRYAGLVLDFEELHPDDLPALLRVAGAIADSARQHQVSAITLAVPAGDTAAYPAAPLLQVADLLLVMLYDQHWSGSPAGPIAEPTWVRRMLGLRVAEVGASRLVAALPLYGYQWRRRGATLAIGYEDAHRLAASAGILLHREPQSLTLRAARPGEWELWVSDAELLRVLMREGSEAGVRRFALWRLGLEDPAVWRVVRE